MFIQMEHSIQMEQKMVQTLWKHVRTGKYKNIDTCERNPQLENRQIISKYFDCAPNTWAQLI